MAISEKILNEINKISENDELKELLRDILILEDDGTHKWTKQYEALIDEYLECVGGK